MRSEGTSARVGQVGPPERVSRAVPYGGAKRNRTRAARGQRVGVWVLRAIARRPRPARQQPPRWLPKTRATGATRWLKTRHPTIDCGAKVRRRAISSVRVFINRLWLLPWFGPSLASSPRCGGTGARYDDWAAL